MFKREPVVRLVRPTDINAVTMMDRRCYPYPMTLKTWQEQIKGSGKDDELRIVLVEVQRSAAGFAAWSIDENNIGQLLRLGVLPQLRRRKLGTVLMAAFLKHCRERGVPEDPFNPPAKLKPRCEKARVVVPSIHCIPGDPDDVSAFLVACDFKPTGEVLHDYRVMYGDEVDGYIFERGVHEFKPTI